MRDIKFRGKMILENEWIYGTLLRIPHPPVCIGKEESDKYYIQFADPRYMPDWNMPYKMVQGEIKAETIGQYTGLKDKNGKEIYEGDVVRLKFQKNSLDIFAKVEYSTTYVQYIVTGTKTILYENEPLSDYEEIEVIGNIYDNPNLLKED